ncbi:MAG: ROK family protein [Ignavibacteriales bacterium]|nr:ROK family protein [Ignavibacteriales bacterium]
MNQKEVVLGVDIGGTNTKFGYVDKTGNLLAEGEMSTEALRPSDEFFERLHNEAEKLFAPKKDQLKLVGIGLGAPNGNYYKGTIEQPPNLSWKYVDVVATLKRWYSIPVVLTNDANAAALGEQLFGAAKGMKDFIVITLGTGLGSGIVANGELIYGHDGFAGEIGHTIVDPNGRLCGCGRRGCLETYASASGICRTVEELLHESSSPSELREISLDKLTSKRIYEAAQHGDKLALEAFEMTGRYLGLKLADSVAYTSPEAIILFGGLAAAGDFIFVPTKKYMEEYLLGIFKNKVRLLRSGLPKGNSAILGAAALIWKELLKV